MSPPGRPKGEFRSAPHEGSPVPRTGRAAAPLLGDDRIGLEGRVSADDHQSLKVWLRLLSCSTQIETEIRKRLRAEFGMSLARFDYLAQLGRHPEGLRMNALSRFLMVTGGNVTLLTDELEKDGLVERAVDPDDRRSFRVALTAQGAELFGRIAAVHEAWIVEIFAGMGTAQKTLLYGLLGRLRVQLDGLQGGGAEKAAPAVPEADANARAAR